MGYDLFYSYLSFDFLSLLFLNWIYHLMENGRNFFFLRLFYSNPSFGVLSNVSSKINNITEIARV